MVTERKVVRPPASGLRKLSWVALEKMAIQPGLVISPRLDEGKDFDVDYRYGEIRFFEHVKDAEYTVDFEFNPALQPKSIKQARDMLVARLRNTESTGDPITWQDIAKVLLYLLKETENF